MVDHHFANLKTLKTKAELKMANVYHLFTHLKTATKRNIGVSVYYCLLSLPWKTNAEGKICYCSLFSPHLKMLKKRKMKKAKLAIVYHQQAEILASKCVIIYHQQRGKFKICNSILSSFEQAEEEK